MVPYTPYKKGEVVGILCELLRTSLVSTYQLYGCAPILQVNVMKGVGHCGYIMIAELIVCLAIMSQ